MYLNAADTVLKFPETDGKTPEFLDIEKLIRLARENDIQAIHPGYGYLSENAVFAERCQQEGIIFIGPSPDVIRKMGDKITAKEIASQCGVPMLAGSKGSINSSDEALAIAEKNGYPVIIKAASGGGGRGMRIVHSAAEMPQMYKIASSEAQHAFNDPSVFVEKYIESPKHIEIQIVADNFGNIVHLGERECSVQRKHQKLLEEAPSPALDDTLRAQMASAAITLAKAVNYQSLGTVEFLLDKAGNFFFMEMNTRIQVEHPVTEMITGLDLVELQLRIASGEQLPVKQDDIKLEGWAIECRINAEDVQSDFAPCTGTIKKLRFPFGENVRIDTGVTIGSEITPWFDSMIAKLIVHGKNRNEAITLALEGLRSFHVRGVKNTIPFCKAVLHNQAFRSGNFDTSFIESQLESPVFREQDEEFAAALFAVFCHAHEVIPSLSPDNPIDPWVLNKRLKNIL